MQRSDEDSAYMQEIFNISPETITRMEQAATTLQAIPKEEQVQALDYILQQIATQQTVGVREMCYQILRLHPLPKHLPF